MAVEQQAERLRRTPRSLAFVRCRIDAATVINYLAVLAAGHPAVLIDDGMNADRRSELEDIYAPRLVLHPDGAIEERAAAPRHELHPQLALMLTTSGSTGSPKLVRLTVGNLQANARSIIEYLEIGPDERAIASLPFHYSYGLSVLNTHLLAGASRAPPGGGDRSPALLGGVRGASLYLVRRRPLLVRDPRAHRLATSCSALAADDDPGGRAARS